MASIGDSVFLMFAILLFAISAVVGVMFFNLVSPVVADGMSEVPEAAAVMTNFSSFLPGLFNWVFSILLLALPIIGLGLALLVPVNVFWWWVYAALSVAVVAVGWLFQDFYNLFVSVELFGDAASSMFVLDLVMSNYLLYCVFMFAVIGFGTYYKQSRGFSGVPGGGGFV